MTCLYFTVTAANSVGTSPASATTDAVIEFQTFSGLSARRRHLRSNHLCIANPLPANTKIPTISSIGPATAPPNDTTNMKPRNPRTRQASSPTANVSKVTISNLNLCLILLSSSGLFFIVGEKSVQAGVLVLPRPSQYSHADPCTNPDRQRLRETPVVLSTPNTRRNQCCERGDDVLPRPVFHGSCSSFTGRAVSR